MKSVVVGSGMHREVMCPRLARVALKQSDGFVTGAAVCREIPVELSPLAAIWRDYASEEGMEGNRTTLNLVITQFCNWHSRWL